MVGFFGFAVVKPTMFLLKKSNFMCSKHFILSSTFTFFCIFICYSSLSQSNFSHINDYGLFRTKSELLYETDENYFAIGYAEEQSEPELGLTVSCHNKKTGEVCSSTYYTIKNKWIFTAGRTPVFHVNDALIFGALTGNKILKLKYDLLQKNITLIDSIVNPLQGGYYLNDMILAGDTTIYHATVIQENNSISSIIHKYPDGRIKHTYLPNPPDFSYSGGRFITKENGNFIIFGSLSRKSNVYEIYLSIVEIDSVGTILREFKTPKTDYQYVTDT